MNRQLFIIGTLSVSVLLLFAGCVSSEETGADTKALSPVKILVSADTNRNELTADTSDVSGAEQSKTGPKFTSDQDTLLASVIKRSKTALRVQNKKDNPERSVYTVQIGAYGKASNALRMQKRAKEQFAFQPVYSEYDKDSQIYRVNIGRYENREEILVLFDSIKQKLPDEYKQCWINLIP